MPVLFTVNASQFPFATVTKESIDFVIMLQSSQGVKYHLASHKNLAKILRRFYYCNSPLSKYYVILKKLTSFHCLVANLVLRCDQVTLMQTFIVHTSKDNFFNINTRELYTISSKNEMKLIKQSSDVRACSVRIKGNFKHSG